MELVTLRTFDNPIDAHLLKSKLESEGIECFLFDEHIVSLNPLYNITFGGIKLKVRSDSFERAEMLAEQFESSPFMDESGEPIRCPRCESEKLYGGFKSMKSKKGILSAMVSFFFMVFPIYYKTVFRCKQCGYEFDK